jgi:hypothetical protein
MSSGKKKGLCLDLVASRSDRVVVKHGWCRSGTKHPERTHVQLRDEDSLRGGNVVDSVRGNLYCLVRELAFLVML